MNVWNKVPTFAARRIECIEENFAGSIRVPIVRFEILWKGVVQRNLISSDICEKGKWNIGQRAHRCAKLERGDLFFESL